jgi:hypothetical protein
MYNIHLVADAQDEIVRFYVPMDEPRGVESLNACDELTV